MFPLFVVAVSLAVIFFFAGFHFENYPTFMASGVLFLLLSIGVYATGITIQTGELIEEQHPCNESWVCGEQNTYYNLTTTIEYQYTSSEGIGNAVLGSFFLAMTFFAFGCALIYATPKEDRENNPDHIEYNYY